MSATQSPQKQVSLQEWMLTNFSDEEIHRIAERGCDRGTRKVAYYEQTTALYEQYKNIFWAILAEIKRQKAPGQLMLPWFVNETSCCSIPGSYTNDDGDIVQAEKFEQRVVWYSLRHVARSIIEERSFEVATESQK